MRPWGRGAQPVWPPTAFNARAWGEVLLAYRPWVSERGLLPFAELAEPHHQKKGHRYIRARHRYARERAIVMRVPLWAVGVAAAFYEVGGQNWGPEHAHLHAALPKVLHALRGMPPHARVETARAIGALAGIRGKDLTEQEVWVLVRAGKKSRDASPAP